jgi:hypothetical protein
LGWGFAPTVEQELHEENVTFTSEQKERNKKRINLKFNGNCLGEHHFQKCYRKIQKRVEHHPQYDGWDSEHILYFNYDYATPYTMGYEFILHVISNEDGKLWYENPLLIATKKNEIFNVKNNHNKMYTCDYCDIVFKEKRLLVTHQRTKKCITHRSIGFTCQKCCKNIIGYDNTLKHVMECKEKIEDDYTSVTTLMNQLSLRYKVNLTMEGNFEGRIDFKRVFNYSHPTELEHGVEVPQRPYLFSRALNKYIDRQIMGSHNLYLNDIQHKILRLSDTFQFMGVKYGFEKFLNILWLETSMPCFHLKDQQDIYILGKIQCQNDDQQKWFGDTFILKESGEKIVKCVWYKDPQLKHFFSSLTPLIKDLLNLYLKLGNWALKQKKIRFKQTTDEFQPKDRILTDLMVEYNLLNLVENLQKLSSYETFYPIFKNLLDQKLKGSNLHSNIEHVFFKDEIRPSDETTSLMTMSDPELTTGNYYYLMDYILPQSEKTIFRSKE